MGISLEHLKEKKETPRKSLKKTVSDIVYPPMLNFYLYGIHIVPVIFFISINKHIYLKT